MYWQTRHATPAAVTLEALCVTIGFTWPFHTFKNLLNPNFLSSHAYIKIAEVEAMKC